MNILVSIAQRVEPHTVAPLRRELGYLIFYEGNLKKLTDHVKEVEGKRDQIKHLVEAERRNGKEIESVVQNWLDRVDAFIQEANQLQEDPCRENVGCSGWLFPNLLNRHRLSKTATKMAEGAVELGKMKFDLVGYLPALDGVGPPSAVRGSEQFETRKSIKDNILQALRDPKVSKIGVYGLGGVGKTTLVKEVAQKAKDDKLFDVVVKADVTQTPDHERIQGEIADKLGLQFDEKTVAGRASRLNARIKREKTILLILDDIWTRLDLEKVGIPFGDEHNGCKVLMTSRNQDVLREMEAQKDFRLEVLSEEETWSLFKVMTGDVDKEPSLQQIAYEVAKKCVGLPVLIVTVARALKNQDIYAWKDALNQLARVDNKELQEITYSALELSYNRLEGSEMKALFLLCAAIGGRPSINDLFKYGMGISIFHNTNTVNDARIRLHMMLKALKASCLFLEDDTGVRVKMHDTVREVAISIASRDHHVLIKKGAELKEWPTEESLARCHQIFLDECDIPQFPKRLECPNLELFSLFSASRYLKIPNFAFEGMANLKVLDITRMNLSTLPASFCSLTNLKTLCLDLCVLENIDGIGALKNLEILSFLKSSMVKLPSEIGKLTQLRMLDLTKLGIEVIPANVISSLTKLEELYMGNTAIKWEVENSTKQKENASLAELRQLSNLTALELQIHEDWILPRDLMFEKLERFKIVIGDVWEWSDIKDETLKILKLKLGTNINLEHGIKSMIRRVENLYLDEVDGISNVLYQLNWEGFPLLKHLHIQNNSKIKHIIDSTDRNQVQASFANLEALVLHNLNNLEKICHCPLAVNSFGKLRVIKVKNCIHLKYLLFFSMVKELSHLSEIEVCQCNFMKNVVLADNNASVDDDRIEFSSLRSLTLQHLQTIDHFFSNGLTSSIAKGKYQRLGTYSPVPFFSAKVVFPNLETLKLSSLNLNKIWDDNHSVHNLANLTVENCSDLKYLFSSTMVGSFLNLKRLEISECHMMEEIIVTGEETNGVPSKEVRFLKLETIILKDMKNLKTIWHSQFDNLNTLEVRNCEKIVVVFPSSMQRTYHNLETLVVTGCASVEEIFELTSNEMSSKEDTIQLKRITLDGLPKLKQAWSRDPQGILSFRNLQDLWVLGCENLEYVFPLSVAMSCLHLRELGIRRCGVKEIVAKKEGSMPTTAIFVFNQLTYLSLSNLKQLKRFYAENHSLMCPSLRHINVWNCEKLKLFKTESADREEGTSHGKLHVSVQQPLFTIEEAIQKLETLSLNNEDASMIMQGQFSGALFTKLKLLRLINYENEESTFPRWFLQNIYSLEHLCVEWSSFKEIFQDGRLGENCTRLKVLVLYQLPKLQHLCQEGSQLDPILEFLENLYVDGCSSLTNLAPSSVTFCHLNYLEISNCNGLINLITSPTARRLAKLTTMKIKECNSLEEIMAKTGNETIDNIAFSSLEILKLECLPKLNKFSSIKCFLRFPLLEKVLVRQCPLMKIFSEGNTSTPNLRKVHMTENGDEWYWKGSLNDTIKNMFEDKVAFHSITHLILYDCPELQDWRYGQHMHKIFGNLKSLEVQKCDFLSDSLFPSNLLPLLLTLEELEVSNCDSLEAVFDIKGMNDREMMVRETSPLRKFRLSGLPKLKHIWNGDPKKVIRFGNLRMVDIFECHSLEYLFPFSLCHDLGHLEELNIELCGFTEIVAMEEGSQENFFNFPQLTELRLRCLRNLKSFYLRKHTLECPALKTLNAFRCEELQMFSFDHLDFQHPHLVNEIHHMPIQQPLFSIEKVSSNLEDLALNGKDAMRILKGQYKEYVFHKVEILRLQCFNETPIIFLIDFLEVFPNLVTLQVRDSSFETLFPMEGIGHCSTEAPKKIKKLLLFLLEQLRYIWHEDSPLDHLGVQNLEFLSIRSCPSLTTLLPSSISFKNLTYLEVDECNKLTYVITPSTAKSLIQLQELRIENCEMIENVVKTDEEGEEEIIFENLEHLAFTSLSSFKSFCQGKHTFIFPSFSRLIVKGCPKMSFFSPGVIISPFLTAVEVENGEKWWKDDLNTTIEKLFNNKSKTSTLSSADNSFP